MSNGELIPGNDPMIGPDLLGNAGNEAMLNNSVIYRKAYQELCEIITGKKPTETPPPEEEFKVKVVAFIDSKHEEMHEKVCDEFGYCDKRKKTKNASDFSNALAALLGIIFDSVSCGSASAVWLMSTSVLDQLCGCSK